MFRAAAARSIYMRSDLTACRRPRAYMTGASMKGYGALARDGTMECSLGFPNLKAEDQAKVDEDIELCRIAVGVVKICVRLELGVTVENPRSSVVGGFPHMKEILGAVLRHLGRTSRAWVFRVLFFTDSQARMNGIIKMVDRIRGYFRRVPSDLSLAELSEGAPTTTCGAGNTSWTTTPAVSTRWPGVVFSGT